MREKEWGREKEYFGINQRLFIYDNKGMLAMSTKLNIKESIFTLKRYQIQRLKCDH
jgi:hypothetical protein